jgi:xanthine dehydrogenase accessory factor
MDFNNLTIIIRGAGELASGVAHRLHRCNFKVCLTEIAHPMAVRREVSFCEAVYDVEKEVEGVIARRIDSPEEIEITWKQGKMPLLIDTEANVKDYLKPNVLIDAIIAKRNVGTKITDAELVIGLGVGFFASKDVHLVIETNRGHDLGRIIRSGEAQPDTGVPGEIAGKSIERLIRTPRAGLFTVEKNIGDMVKAGESVANVDGAPVVVAIDGVIRGLLRNGMQVTSGLKAGDVDPRGDRSYCYTISDKARAISGGVLEAILAYFNTPEKR